MLAVKKVTRMGISVVSGMKAVSDSKLRGTIGLVVYPIESNLVARYYPVFRVAFEYKEK